MVPMCLDEKADHYLLGITNETSYKAAKSALNTPTLSPVRLSSVCR